MSSADPRADLTIEELRASNALVLRLAGSLDSLTSPSLGARLDGLNTRSKPEIVLDLAKVSYISSAGLGVIMRASTTLASAGGSLALAAPQKHVKDAFDISGLGKRVALYRSLEAALAKSIENFAPEASDCPLQRNKDAVLRFLMMIQFCAYAELPSVVHDGMRVRLTPSLDHAGQGSDLGSADEFESHLRDLHSVQDIDILVESMVAEGDLVATNNITTRRYRDGRTMSTRFMAFYRLKDHRIVEKTDVYDRLHEQQQLAASAG